MTNQVMVNRTAADDLHKSLTQIGLKDFLAYGDVKPLRSYRATTIPLGVNFDEVELSSDQGTLPTIQVKAANAGQAAFAAHKLTGRPVLKVERIEVAE